MRLHVPAGSMACFSTEGLRDTKQNRGKLRSKTSEKNKLVKRRKQMYYMTSMPLDYSSNYLSLSRII